MKKKTIIISILAILISSIFSEKTFSYTNNLKEIKAERIQYKSAKLVHNSELQLCSININWWENFSDPYLKKYVYQAITENHNLKKISLLTEEHRQNIKTSLAKELPTLGISPTFARIKTASNQIADIETAQTRTNIYAIPLIASYEADIFLKNHDKTKAKKEEKNSYEYKEKTANIAMASEVASLYINILKFDKTIKTQEKIVKIREKIFELTKERNKVGLASVYDVTYTDKLHTQALIELNELKKQQNLNLHKFAVYINYPPYLSHNIQRGDFDNLEYNKEIPTHVSSDVIANRPDILEIESKLKKAKFEIKAAKKEFLPTIPIFGIVGYNSSLIKRLFDWDSIIALIGVSAMQKLYTGGLYMANLRIQKLKFEQLLEEYKEKDLIAMQEISDVLCMIKYDTEKDKEQLRKIKLEKENLGLLKQKFEVGIMSYLDYIQFEETLLSLQSEQANSKAQRLIDYISLYKVTGTKL